MANSLPRNAIYSYPKSGRSGELVALAISSKKRATASLLRDYATGVEPVPQAGDFVVFVDGGGRPRCIWRTTGVIVKPFIDVDDAFAWDEGERERTRDWWLLDRSGNGSNVWHALRRRWRALMACDRGVSAVEFALTAPFPMALMLGLMDFGSAGIHKRQMVNSVRAGLQYAMVRRPVEGDLSAIEAAVDNAAPTASGPRTVALYCQCPDGTATACSAACATGLSTSRSSCRNSIG